MNLNRATQLVGLMVSVFLTACGGGGSGSSSGDVATEIQNIQPASELIQITAAGIKGPLAFADARIYAVDTSQPEFYDRNSPIAVDMSDQFAEINKLSIPRAVQPPYILIVDGSDAIDLNSGMRPVINSLVTVITADMLNNNRPVYATPLTSLTYHIARHNSEPSANIKTFVREVNNASAQVSDLFAINKDTKIDVSDSPLLINDTTVSLAEQREAVNHRAAVEAFSAKVNALALAKGDGLHATYFNDSTLSSIVLERIDTTIDFHWQDRRPAASVNRDNFSIRWAGLLEADFSEDYTLYTSTDDGVRLWVDGQLIIDQWTDHSETEFQGNIQLTAGQKYPITMEYYDNTGGATARLSWSSNSLPKSIVPQTNLYSVSDAAMLDYSSTDAIIERIAIDLQSDGVIDNMASGSALGGIDPAIINQDPVMLEIPNTTYTVQNIVGLMEEERILIGTDRGPTFQTDSISLRPSPQAPPVEDNTPPPAEDNTPPPAEDNTPPPAEDNTPPPVVNNTPPTGNTTGGPSTGGSTSGSGSTNTNTANGGPIQVHPSNPQYFLYKNKAIRLAGHQNIWETQDNAWETNLLALLSTGWSSHVQYMKERQLNHLKNWVFWSTGIGSQGNYVASPLPFKRVSGSGVANDGNNKFDLTQFDQDYFDRLYQMVQQAEAEDIIVTIMLFDVYTFYDEFYLGNPFQGDNNVQGVDVDTNGNGSGLEFYEKPSSQVAAIQKNYVKEVLDTLNDFDNVFYEIVNECNCTTWQRGMIDFIRNYEASKPKQHLVLMSPGGRTDQGAGGWTSIAKNTIVNSSADVFSVGNGGSWTSGGSFTNDPPLNTASKPAIMDMDHIDAWAYPSDSLLPWKAFTRGYHYNLMEINWHLNDKYDAQQERARFSTGATAYYANERFTDLARMISSKDACSTSYCLSDTGNEYLVFQPSSGVVTVYGVQSGATYEYEWFNVSSHAVTAAGQTVTANGSSLSLVPPYSNAVLFLYRK